VLAFKRFQTLTVAIERRVQMDVVADPTRLQQLDLAVLDE
jgi:hypothetical protein